MKKKTQVILASLLLIIILIAYIYFITIGWAILGTYLNSNNDDSGSYRASFVNIDISTPGNEDITVYCPVPVDENGKTIDAVYKLVSEDAGNLSLINTEHGLMLKIRLNGSISLSDSSKNASHQAYLSSDNSDSSMEYGEKNGSAWVYVGGNVSSNITVHFKYEIYGPGLETVISGSGTINPEDLVSSWTEMEYTCIRAPPPTP